MSERVKNLLATSVSMVLLAVLLDRVFVSINRWGAHAFTRPILASMLVAVLDLAVFAATLFVAPSLSALLRKALR